MRIRRNRRGVRRGAYGTASGASEILERAGELPLARRIDHLARPVGDLHPVLLEAALDPPAEHPRIVDPRAARLGGDIGIGPAAPEARELAAGPPRSAVPARRVLRRLPDRTKSSVGREQAAQ